MKTFLLSCILFCSMALHAQVSELNMMYWNNLPNINPALSGLQLKHHGSVSYRNFSNDEWEPSNLLANYNTRIFKYHGVGINYMQMSRIQWNTHMTNVNYNYQWRLKDARTFSAGIGIGVQGISLDPFYRPYVSALDPIYSIGLKENLNIGFAYNVRRVLIGISLASLTRPQGNSIYYSETARHLNVHGSYGIFITRKISITSKALVQTDFNSIQATVSLLGDYRGKYWLGFGYRTKASASFMAGLNINRKFNLAYAYEHLFSKLNSAGFSNHQITLGFRIPFPR